MDLDRIVRTLTLKEAVDSIRSHHTHRCRYVHKRAVVQAGVVGWHGSILMPGWSLSGKSQVVAALVRAGASYYSGEYAVLDERCRVHPYGVRVGLTLRSNETPTRGRSSLAS